jgi:hypothetical protein
MVTCSHPLRTLDDLRDYILETVCEQHHFESASLLLTERLLVRAGRPCGIYFCLSGPRSVRFTAIWETQHNTILFYGATGQRLRKIELRAASALSTRLERAVVGREND